MHSSMPSNPPDAGIYHWIHRRLLNARSQWLLGPLLSIIFALEGFYANKLRPLLGIRRSEKYLAYSWILGSHLLPSAGSILDLGCGDSLFPSKLASLGYKSHAVDLSPSDCIAASDSRVNFTRADVCDMPFQSGKFDVVTAISTLEHVDPNRMDLAAQEIGRILRKDGTLFVTMPDCDEAESMRQFLIHNFKVLSHEHRLLNGRNEGAGVTFLLLTTFAGKE